MTVLALAVAVTVLPAEIQLPCKTGVADTVMPRGRLSVNVLFR